MEQIETGCGWYTDDKIYKDYHDQEWAYLWNFTGGAPLQPNYEKRADIPTHTDLSTQISKDLKKRGFKFCGPTIVYAFMEAVGMVNDHVTSCPRHEEVQALANRRE